MQNKTKIYEIVVLDACSYTIMVYWQEEADAEAAELGNLKLGKWIKIAESYAKSSMESKIVDSETYLWTLVYT